MTTHHVRQRGDTIIEVLVAITIFSMIAVGALMLMNKGSAMAQRSLEVTLVRQQIDTQADLLRMIHSAYVNDPARTDGPGAQWSRVTGNAYTSGSVPALDNPTDCPTAMPRSFVVARTSPGATTLAVEQFSTVPAAVVYSRVDVNRDVVSRPLAAEGLWVQAVRIPPSNPATGVVAYDLYIRACWESVGDARPMTLGTIVRLYEP